MATFAPFKLLDFLALQQKFPELKINTSAFRSRFQEFEWDVADL